MKFAARLGLLVLVGCSSSFGNSKTLVTVLVENTTCDSVCTPIQVLAFPSTQPHTPGGLWSIEVGTLSTNVGCFVLPPKASFTISGPEGVERTLTWTIRDAVSLGSSPPGERIRASPSTEEFVPTSAPGWTVRLPTRSALIATDKCSP